MKNKRHIFHFTALVTIIWTCLWISLSFWSYFAEKDHGIEGAIQMARAASNKDLSLRHWAADRGSIYVEVSNLIQPNPNLKNIPERDIKTPSGRDLTLINPAYILRQVMNDFSEEYGMQGRITSLKPLWAPNTPDQWERKALIQLQEGGDEVLEMISINEKPYLRLMKPLIVTPKCLECHADQGYKEGDIRGGVGINVPLSGIYATAQKRTKRQILFLSILWLLGTIGLILKNRQITLIEEKQSRYIRFAELGKELGLILINETPLSEMLQQCAELLNSYLGTLFLKIWLIDPTEEVARLTASAGKAGSLNDRHQIKQLNRDNMIGLISIDGKTYVSNNLNDEPLFADTKWLKQNSIRAFAGIPLRTSTRSLGVISCFKQQTIDKEDISLLKPLVNEISLGIARKYGEMELQQANDNLERDIADRTNEMTQIHVHMLQSEKLAAIGRLSASIAHEFNNPLAGITTVIQGIKRRATYDVEDAKLINLALDECRRIKNLIISLQDFNQPSSSKMAIIDVHALLESLFLLNKYELKTHDITLKTHFATDMPFVTVVADQLKQALLNILSNAIYACRKGDIITVSTESTQDNLIIRITDTGIGIKSRDMEHIFEPFFSTKPEVKGIGLGLPVSYGIIKRYGGDITIHSEENKGTTVSIIIPIKAP